MHFIGVPWEVICQICCISLFVLISVVVALDSELVFQDFWWRFSSQRLVYWHQGFMTPDENELWQSIQVYVTIGDSKFDGSTFYFNLSASLLLRRCLSAVTTWCCCASGSSCVRILERLVFVDPSIINLVFCWDRSMPKPRHCIALSWWW